MLFILLLHYSFSGFRLGVSENCAFRAAALRIVTVALRIVTAALRIVAVSSQFPTFLLDGTLCVFVYFSQRENNVARDSVAGSSAAPNPAGTSTADSEDDVLEVVDDNLYRRKCKQRSNVWNYFDKTTVQNESGNFLAKCKLCGDMISTTNTTNMQTHLNRLHASTMIFDPRNGSKVTRTLIFEIQICFVFFYTFLNYS